MTNLLARYKPIPLSLKASCIINLVYKRFVHRSKNAINKTEPFAQCKSSMIAIMVWWNYHDTSSCLCEKLFYSQFDKDTSWVTKLIKTFRTRSGIKKP